MKTCSKCGLTLRGSDQEGDICLTCLSSLTPHCNFDQGYSTIEGAIRQSTDNPMRTEITPKDFKYINQPRNKMITRIKIEDYNGNDIVELNLNFEILAENIVETDDYNIADLDEDDNGEYIRVQLNHPERIL